MNNIILAPSLLACDFARVAEQLDALMKSGIDTLHLDVMDGIFVPNISFGQPVIKSLRKSCPMVFDVHLMITDPMRYIKDFAEAGADIITIHYESCDDPGAALAHITACGKLAGLSIKPKTKAEEIFHLLPYCNLVLVMTVEPGFGGQSFMADMLPKIADIKAECNRQGLATTIEVDGGIDETNAAAVTQAGATMLVAGSSVFGKPDLAAAVDSILNACETSPSKNCATVD